MFYSGTDAYTNALPLMGHDLANKYANYYNNKVRQIKRNRVSLSNVDAGRSKVYQSEFSMTRKNSELNQKMTEKECLNYFNKIKKSVTYQKLCKPQGDYNPRLRIMKDMGGSARIAGQASSQGMALAPSGFTKYTILHEFAHLSGNMHHDVGFRQDLLKLVSRFLGVKYAKDLKKEFRSRKLKLSVSAVIQSPAKWLEAYQRMAEIRSKVGVLV
tara:strand:- start:2798 stop:3439 length:642 start_codon:yes stop_codon:yes gene_type:complete